MSYHNSINCFGIKYSHGLAKGAANKTCSREIKWNVYLVHQIEKNIFIMIESDDSA